MDDCTGSSNQSMRKIKSERDGDRRISVVEYPRDSQIEGILRTRRDVKPLEAGNKIVARLAAIGCEAGDGESRRW